MTTESSKNGEAKVIVLPDTANPAKIVGRMTPEEELRVQNIAVRHENLLLRKERLQMEALLVSTEEKKLQEEAMKVKNDIAARLSTTPDKLRFRQDGTIEETV